MITDEEFRKKPHLTNKDRCPRTYKEVEKILRTVKNCKANAKTVLHNAKLSRNIFNKVYALTFNVLKQNHLLNSVIEEIHLLEKEPFLRKELAEILLHELILGKGLPPSESKPVQTVRKYEFEIQKAYKHLLEKGVSFFSGIYSIPKYVRVNTLVTTIPEVLENLEYLGVEQIFYDDSISESGYLELVKNLKRKTFLIDKHFKDLLVFHSDENIANWSLYQKGYTLIQDKSSYIPPHVLSPESGSVVLDACAAPGMKTLHLASIMGNNGTLYAFERDKNRFEILENMLQSGHTDIFQTFCQDFNSVDVNDEKFSTVEYILLDPSCSGSGMVNRMDSVTDTEESKNDARIQKLAGFQIVLLKHALLFPSVKRVVYSTCSITEQENEYVVHEALNHFRHKFKLTHVLPDWPIRGSEEYEFGPLCLRAYPDKSLTNGFFVAMFERIDSFDEHNNTSYGKRTRKVKKKDFIVEETVLSKKEISKIKKEKSARDSQNYRDTYRNNLHENSYNHVEENIDSNEKDSDNLFYKKQIFAQGTEIKDFVTDDSLKQKNIKFQQVKDEKNSTTEQLSTLNSKKRKKKNHTKDDKKNCDNFSGFQEDEAHNLNSVLKNNEELENTKCELKTNEKENSSSEPVVELHCKKRKKKHHYKNDIQAHSDEFIKNDETNNFVEENNISDPVEKLQCKKHKKKHHNKKEIQANYIEFIQNNATNVEEISISDFGKLNSKKHKKKHYDKNDLQANRDRFIPNDEISKLNKNFVEENCISDLVEKLHSKKHKKKYQDKNKALENPDEFVEIKKNEVYDFKNLTNNDKQEEFQNTKQHKKFKHSKKHKKERKDIYSIDQLNLSSEKSFSNNNEAISEYTSHNLLHKHRKKSKKSKNKEVT